MYFIYFLQSTINKRFYIGCSGNPEKRLLEHNQGNTRSTKPYRPWTLVYTEKFETKNEAYKREWFLKHPVGYKEKRNIVERITINTE